MYLYLETFFIKAMKRDTKCIRLVINKPFPHNCPESLSQWAAGTFFLLTVFVPEAGSRAFDVTGTARAADPCGADGSFFSETFTNERHGRGHSQRHGSDHGLYI